MKDLNHLNVLNLKGICITEDCIPLIVLPLMQKGDLLSYIRNADNLIKINDLFNFAFGIARGI
jgi:serine/threonine protein kinase